MSLKSIDSDCTRRNLKLLPVQLNYSNNSVKTILLIRCIKHTPPDMFRVIHSQSQTLCIELYRFVINFDMISSGANIPSIEINLVQSKSYKNGKNMAQCHRKNSIHLSLFFSLFKSAQSISIQLEPHQKCLWLKCSTVPISRSLQ